jgi:hypothetical protein
VASPLNVFKSISANVTTVASNVYVCPAETTTIVLLAQATNIHANERANVTFYTSIDGTTELVKDFVIPPNDAAGLLTGKLVIEAGEAIGIYSDANNKLKLTMSILETK